MKHPITFATGLLASVALAGCVENTGSSSASNPLFPNVGFAPEVSNAAVSACGSAVDAQTDGDVEVVGSEFSQAASVVYLVVGPQRAPWRCLAGDDGSVTEVMFVGSEGAA